MTYINALASCSKGQEVLSGSPVVPSLTFTRAGSACGNRIGASTSTRGAPGTGEHGCLASPSKASSGEFEGFSASSRNVGELQGARGVFFRSGGEGGGGDLPRDQASRCGEGAVGMEEVVYHCWE